MQGWLRILSDAGNECRQALIMLWLLHGRVDACRPAVAACQSEGTIFGQYGPSLNAFDSREASFILKARSDNVSDEHDGLGGAQGS